MTELRTGQSGSLAAPEYWWYRARSRLFETVFGTLVVDGGRILEIGSADGPSVDWLGTRGWRIATDIDPSSLPPDGVCASAVQLPFDDAAFDVVAAFDVIEHVEDEAACLTEMRRLLRPGGLLLLSVPAYEWAWTRFDDLAGHHRRYTRGRLVAHVGQAGFHVHRATYAFTSTFPLFLVDRFRARLLQMKAERPADSRLSGWMERFLLSLAGLDMRILKSRDLPFGSSVLLAARRRSMSGV